MKSMVVPATAAAVAVLQIGCAGASIDVRPVSLTSDDIPTHTSATSTPTTSDTVASTSSESSASVTSPPTASSGQFTSFTSAGTATQTLGGVEPTTILSGTLTQSQSASSSPNAAATPARIGAGVLAGMLGVVAAL